MNEQALKVSRGIKAIKVFMAFIVLLAIYQYYESGVIDMGAIAGTLGALALFRGLILTPSLLSMPLSQWKQSDHKLTSATKRYFLLALALIIISSF